MGQLNIKIIIYIKESLKKNKIILLLMDRAYYITILEKYMKENLKIINFMVRVQ